jgi:hypothetical protein
VNFHYLVFTFSKRFLFTMWMNEREGLSPWASEETKFREICEVKICQAVTWFNVPFTGCVLSAALCWKICTYTAYTHSLFFQNIISCTYICAFNRIFSFSIYTDRKENQIFLIYKEIQSGAVEKSYMRKGFLIYSMRKCVNIS